MNVRSPAAVDVHKDMGGPVPARPNIQSAPVPPGTPRRWRWVVIGSIIGIGSVVWIAGFIAYATHDHPGGFIGDRGFIDAANAACREARARLRRAPRPMLPRRNGQGSWRQCTPGCRHL